MDLEEYHEGVLHELPCPIQCIPPIATPAKKAFFAGVDICILIY